MKEFKPNSLNIDDIENLEDWELLVSVCHFAPGMKDCVDLDYSYTFKEYRNFPVYKSEQIFCGDTCLKDDIDIDEPIKALKTYLNFSWQEYAKYKLKSFLKDRIKED